MDLKLMKLMLEDDSHRPILLKDGLKVNGIRYKIGTSSDLIVNKKCCIMELPRNSFDERTLADLLPKLKNILTTPHSITRSQMDLKCIQRIVSRIKEEVPEHHIKHDYQIDYVTVNHKLDIVFDLGRDENWKELDYVIHYLVRKMK